MRKLFLSTAILLAFGVAHAHDTAEMTEDQQEIALIQEELELSFARAKLLQDTLVDVNATAEHKCGHLEELAGLVTDIHYALQHYASVANRAVQNVFFDPSVEANMAFVLPREEYVKSINAVIPIHKANYNCKD